MKNNKNTQTKFTKKLLLILFLLFTTNFVFSQFIAYRADDAGGIPDCGTVLPGIEIWGGMGITSIDECVAGDIRITDYVLVPYGPGWFGDTDGELYFFDGIRWNPIVDVSCGGGALPIVLTGWDVEIVGESASLTWTVESQINNDYYTIHKSLDGEEWEEVARVPGTGNTNTTMNYHIFDEKPYVGQSYYRLMQTDYDGNYEIFNMIGVFWDKPIALSINPNPVEEVLTLYLSETLRGVTHITIFNTKGQRIYGKSFVGNWKVIELDVTEYKKGYYLLDVDHNHRKGTLKFIKE